MNPDGMVALLNYREDGITRMSIVCTLRNANNVGSLAAYFTFWKDGLKEVKL